jgi:regulator of cell morphogenesis and NO signaling
MAGSIDRARLGPPDWALDDLVDHVIDRHHRYAQGSIPALRDALARAAERWGQRHPPVTVARALFEELASTLEPHLLKEEHLLFPAIRSLTRAARAHLPKPPEPFPTLAHPIRVMEAEHAHLLRLLDDLRREAGDFHAPEEADESGRDCYRQLARFCSDLAVHLHLETDELFPRALDLERRLR